ncbi:MAG: coproporphyrinogen III oxidase family protein [Spirochaetales bacterium]|nr:coproporphyrinogen III oxidase family protein [Spirochaetales bacterium]
MSFLSSFDTEKGLSLYIHVPFCISKCAYCAFYSRSGCSDQVMDSYTERIGREISLINGIMKGKTYETAFIGGGNPGCLGPERLARIAKAVCANGRPSEFSVEMNPESLGEGFFPLFEKYFTRLSMGVQSLDEKALPFLGRNADLKSTRRGLELSQKLRETGCTVSYDLITCLGKWHDEISDVKALVENYRPDHLSVYALTLEEGTPLHRRKPDLPDEDEQYSILSRVWKYLADQGFEHYEVSNFAKPGFRCSHNCRYWAYEQYLGLGPGAASTAFSKDGSVHRFSFRPDVDSYVSNEPLTGFGREDLSRTEAVEELVLMGLRYKGGLDLARLENMAGKCLDSGFLKGLNGFSVNDGHLVPDDDGLMTADAAAEAIIGQFY